MTEATGQQAPDQGAPQATDQQAQPSVRGIAFEMSDGSPASMDQYLGQVVLVVNVASACGLRGQVAELETLYQANKDKGLVVLAFPSASFNQEPLDAPDAARFCQDQGATYPVAAKVPVRGPQAHPLFQALSAQGGEPDWNYTKYLVDRQGNVVARFGPRVSPSDPQVQQAIDRALAG